VKRIWNLPITKLVIENPQGALTKHLGRPQYIQTSSRGSLDMAKQRRLVYGFADCRSLSRQILLTAESSEFGEWLLDRIEKQIEVELFPALLMPLRINGENFLTPRQNRRK